MSCLGDICPNVRTNGPAPGTQAPILAFRAFSRKAIRLVRVRSVFSLSVSAERLYVTFVYFLFLAFRFSAERLFISFVYVRFFLFFRTAGRRPRSYYRETECPSGPLFRTAGPLSSYTEATDVSTPLLFPPNRHAACLLPHEPMFKPSPL